MQDDIGFIKSLYWHEKLSISESKDLTMSDIKKLVRS